MKSSKMVIGLLMLITSAASTALSQQTTFIQTVTSQSTNCNAACSVLAINALSNNPAAIVFVTLIGGNPNPHTIGVYYMYLNKWSIFDLDQAAIPIGAKYNVEYGLPDANHFVYVVPQRVSPKDPSYIDHVGLNGNPNAHIRVIARITPTIGNHWNKDPVEVEYDGKASKWFIANTNGTPVPSDSAYNVVVSDEPVITNSNVNNTINTNPQKPLSTAACNCVIPTSLPPTGTAGGGLGGSYPNPSVQSLQGKPVSNVQPKLGQVLKWGVEGWVPSDESALTATTIAPFQTFMKNPGPSTKTIGELELSDNRPMANLSELAHSIVLTKRSRLIISAAIGLDGPFCLAGCSDAEGSSFIRINNNGQASSTTFFAVGNNRIVTLNISNYMVDLNAGTYSIEFVVQHSTGKSPFAPSGKYSSVIVVPL